MYQLMINNFQRFEIQVSFTSHVKSYFAHNYAVSHNYNRNQLVPDNVIESCAKYTTVQCSRSYQHGLSLIN